MEQHIWLIVEVYDLIDFLDGSVDPPPQFVQDSEGRLVLNLTASAFTEQDKLLASWLLSTISGLLLT